MNGIRRIDADAYLPAVDLKYGDDDVLSYLQGFAGGAGENKHTSLRIPSLFTLYSTNFGPLTQSFEHPPEIVRHYQKERTAHEDMSSLG